jgi:5-methylcytosine-specific restriction endonuclease McrA
VSKFDWKAIRDYYDAGRTRQDCQDRFGFSNGAWNRAADRGDIDPRPKSSGLRASEKRALVGELIAAGKSYSRIAADLGLTKSTVAYHARRLGIPVDERASRRYDWDEVQVAYDSGLSVRDCMKRFGFTSSSWTKAVQRGAVIPRPQAMPLEELLVEGRARTSRGNVKRRLIKAGLKEDRCERCGISEWQGKPLSLELHHINGDGLDNRIGNLEILCANCHSQTDTWGGRNGHRKPRA